MRSSAAPFFLGVASVAGFAPFGLFFLPWLTLAALFHLWVRADSLRAVALFGFAFGLGLFVSGVSWVYVSMHDFGAMPAPLAAGVTLVFCAFLALFPAAAGTIAARVRASRTVKLCLLFPAAWAAMDWLRGWLFTGFPWLVLGYAAVPASPLAGFAPILGVYGVGHVSALIAGCLAWSMSARGARRGFGLLAIVALLGLGQALRAVEWTVASGRPVGVSLVQGNVPQDIKWRPERLARTLDTYARLVEASPGPLIVLPETALPLFLDQVPRAYLARVADHARARGGDLVVGVAERLPEGGYANSAVSLGTHVPQVYRKVHLVPFGEYVPLRLVFGWLVERMSIPLTDFTRGSASQGPLALGEQRLAISICYEDAFGEEVIRMLPAATLLANLSNDAWFGDSIAPHQHLQMAQMRALETGRPMLRATNTGITAVIDHRGRVTSRLPAFTEGVLSATVQGRTGSTPYVTWGNGPAVALMLASFLAVVDGVRSLIFSPRRRSRTKN